jgi:hypothetical protein
MPVLQEVDGHVDEEIAVGPQRRQRVVARVEAVHQDEWQPNAMAAAEREDLTGDDVQEGQPVLGLDEGLRAGQAHARPRARR